MQQPGIMPAVPRAGRYLSFSLQSMAQAAAVRDALHALPVDESLVVGLGPATVDVCQGSVPGLHAFEALQHGPQSSPSTQDDLWLWVRGDDAGEVTLAAHRLIEQLSPLFTVQTHVSAFRYREGRDLSGYVDGTENPSGDDAVRAAFMQDAGSGLDGSSLVAVQQWVHELGTFEAHTQSERDNMIGRTAADDIELDDAPESAHVKRTAQESFTPEAFVLRRSMPWSEQDRMGLVFVAFGHSLDAFEAQLRRMMGMEDGTADALFNFTRPITGACYWCPPTHAGRLDLRALGA